jgi:hypothetical protein
VRGLKLILTAESPEQRSSAVGYGIAPATKRLGPRRLRDYQVPWNQRPAQRVLLFEFTIEPGHSVPVLLVVLSHQLVKFHDGHSAEIYGRQAQVENVRDGEVVHRRTSELAFVTNEGHQDGDAM